MGSYSPISKYFWWTGSYSSHTMDRNRFLSLDISRVISCRWASFGFLKKNSLFNDAYAKSTFLQNEIPTVVSSCAKTTTLVRFIALVCLCRQNIGSEYKTEGFEIYGYDFSAGYVEMWSIINVTAPYHMFIATNMQHVTQNTGWPALSFWNREKY